MKLRRSLTALALLGAAAFPLSIFAHATVNNPCVDGSGTCSADANETIVSGKGIGHLVWKGNFQAKTSYTCFVAYLYFQDQGFTAETDGDGIISEPVNLGESGLSFQVTATKDGYLGFEVDGSQATGPSSQTNGPQVTVVCSDSNSHK